ncbi:MAG: hypothetical protein K9L59_11645, partial [Desulfobacterales bacterium]|nr:hypothetical protein [Desulfobacterales bacterium]
MGYYRRPRPKFHISPAADREAISLIKGETSQAVIPGLTSLPQTPIRGNPGISGSRLEVYPALDAGLRYGRDDG